MLSPFRRAFLRTHRRFAVGACVLGVLLLAGCGTEPQPSSPPPPAAGPSGPPGTTPPAPETNCTAKTTDGAGAQRELFQANPGDVICLAGDLSSVRLRITRSGTAKSPIRLLGDGKVVTKGMDIRADHVVVDGISAAHPDAPGITLKGTDITLQNSIVDSPEGGDRDAIRFWGSGLKILHNTLRNTRNEDDAHADCMQTFATDERSPASQDILIDGNRCEKIDNNCLIVEGPNSDAGDGSGVGETRNITWTNNLCDNNAAQAVLLDDVHGARLAGNQIVGHIDHAFAIQNSSSGVVVEGNQLGSGIKFEVGMDASSRNGYQGPDPGGRP